MPSLKSVRLSTDLIGDTLYQAICHPGDHRRSTLVTSNREVIDADFVPLEERGLYPHSDYTQETEEGFRLLVPPNLPHWSEASLSQFAKGGLPPTTLRNHFNSIHSFIQAYVWLPSPVDTHVPFGYRFTFVPDPVVSRRTDYRSCRSGWVG